MEVFELFNEITNFFADRGVVKTCLLDDDERIIVGGKVGTDEDYRGFSLVIEGVKPDGGERA